MSNLTHDNGTHEADTPEGYYMKIFWPAFLNATTRAGIIGNEVGHNYFAFTDKGKTIKITVTVK